MGMSVNSSGLFSIDEMERRRQAFIIGPRNGLLYGQGEENKISETSGIFQLLRHWQDSPRIVADATDQHGFY
jgi:hypothetical protein